MEVEDGGASEKIALDGGLVLHALNLCVKL